MGGNEFYTILVIGEEFIERYKKSGSVHNERFAYGFFICFCFFKFRSQNLWAE